ncbi:MAG: hypothetical protein ACU0CA_08550, partial [Paracoccaceae bacterium]
MKTKDPIKKPVKAAGGRNRTPKALPPAWKLALDEFWAGLTEPSQLGFFAMLAGLASVLVFAFWFFSLATLAGPSGEYLARSEKDAEAFATIEALRLSQNRGNDPLLLVVSSSTLAQAIGEGEILLERLDEANLGNWSLRMLTTPLQSPLDQFALLDFALSGQDETSPPVVVIFGA